MASLIGLMITKEDHEVFGDWCSDQLFLYDAVVCLDGSNSEITREIAEEFPDKIVYLHENELTIPHHTDHGLRGVVHDQIVRRFGVDNWVMCCHADEFCYHEPRQIVAKAEAGGFDLVSWFSPHFYPHPSELPSIHELCRKCVPDRFHYFHWGYLETELPWIEDRLYRNSGDVRWDGVTQGSVRPLGLSRPASFHPVLRHYKVCSLETQTYERIGGHALYAHHWTDQGNLRTGLPFSINRVEDFFVDRVPKYRHCSRFDGTFAHPWNLGDDYCPRRIAEHEDFDAEFRRIQEMIEREAYDDAKMALSELRQRSQLASTKSVIRGNIGVLRVLQGAEDKGCLAFRAALAMDRSNAAALANLDLLAGERNRDSQLVGNVVAATDTRTAGRVRVAIVSLLFNWPSTGGGTIHTKELAEFLLKDGFDVLHIFARYRAWEIGRCETRLSAPTEVVDFDDADWTLEQVIARFQSALRRFQPDIVILTDSWNFKPWLAEAARPIPYVMRYQALENLCPLNNIRLLPAPNGHVVQCGRHQLATPSLCHECCERNGHFSGKLHQLERQFSRVGSGEYDRQLRLAISDATAVLVVNPLMQAMISPWNERTLVVPSGMDPSRFLRPKSEQLPPSQADGKKRILFAGLIDEHMKGFHVLKAACDALWSKRHDFELLVTAEPRNGMADYARFVGWLDQQDLVRYLFASDMLVFPTIAQEALGRTAVEAMGAGVPVVASRIGGLSYTVVDHHTGLLASPGDPVDLAEKIERLLDNERLRQTLGENGRRRFEADFAWPVIIRRHYRPLFECVHRERYRQTGHLPHSATFRRSDELRSISSGCV